MWNRGLSLGAAVRHAEALGAIIHDVGEAEIQDNNDSPIADIIKDMRPDEQLVHKGFWHMNDALKGFFRRANMCRQHFWKL